MQAAPIANERNEFSILIIEDNPGDRTLARIALAEGAGEAGSSCDIQFAENMQQGRALLEDGAKSSPDAILLDLGLPDVVGFEALNILNSIQPSIPVIILTGRDDKEAAASALKFGAADYLEKGELRSRSLWRAVSYAIARKKLESELLSLAITDPLTGIKNRRALFSDLENSIDQARRSELCCAVFVVDIDNFKTVNDILGHEIGDELLRTIACRMCEVLRRTDTVGRLGGDEFAVIASNLKSPTGAIEIAEKICKAISAITQIRGAQITPSVSIGIAIFPTDDTSPETIMSHADIAMYKAKKTDGSSICFYDEELHREIRHRHGLKKAMLNEISTPSFYLDYQPIVDSRTHEIIGAEGLARWKGQNDTVVMPGEFIPIAEENGWISVLGIQVIDRACRFLSESIKAHVPVVPVSINVSPIQCREESFPLHVTSTILKYGLNPKLINIEITETTVMQNIETARRSLEVLKDAGIGIHIDDFGTGYSSLSLLKDLPLNHLKIDRSFISKIIQDVGTRQIMEAISDLSAKLHFKTVAEGVETEEQAEILAGIGIDYLQGYYFSRPLGASRLREKLASNKSRPNAWFDHTSGMGASAAS